MSVGLERAGLEALVARAGEAAALLDTLRSRGLVVDRGHDKLGAYLANRREHLAARSVMRLTVLVTLFCNFRCAYCYESLAGPAMDERTEARLGRFSATSEDLGELLERPRPLRQAVVLHLRWVFPQAGRWRACVQDRAGERAAEAHERILALARAAVASGFRVRNPILHPRVAFCNTEYRNHWVVHPTGELHKCNVEFELGRPCGVLEEDGRVAVDAARLEGWLSKDPAADEQCRECVWLPVCTGGCAFARRNRTGPPCPRGRADRFADYVLLEYQQRKGVLRS